MHNKLIFLDIDGTLVEAGCNVPPQSALDAIRAAQAKGHKVFLCTGRNRGMLAPVLHYGFDGIIGCAGGYIEYEGRVLFDHPMENRQRDIALKALHENGVFCTLEARDITYGDENLSDFLTTAEGDNSEIERWRKALAEGLDIHPMAEYDGRPVYKVVFMCLREEQLAPARALLEADFNFCVQEAFGHACLNGELINRAFDKGRAVLRVCQELGVPVADTIGFGDSMNDYEMIDTVGVGVCMANGSEALKKVSDLVCPAVTEDGLAQAFARLGLV